MADEEFSAALKVLREFARDYLHVSFRDREQLPTPRELFLEKFGVKRGEWLLTMINALHLEASEVDDPGGPIGNYIDKMREWEKTHPEVDPHELGALTYPMIVVHSH